MVTRLRSIALKLLVALLAYCLVGFIALPGVAYYVINQQLEKRAAEPARLESVRFNPFTLELTLSNFRLGATSEPTLAFRRLYANLQVSSLWRQAVQLSTVSLEGAELRARFDSGGALNLNDLFLPGEPVADHPEQPEQGLLPLRIQQFSLTDSRLYFEDHRYGEPVTLHYDQLDLQLQAFSTLPGETASLHVRASGPQGASLDGQGELALQPLRSKGRLQVENVELPGFWPYVRPHLAGTLDSATASLRSDYQLDMTEGLGLTLSELQLTLQDLTLRHIEGEPQLSLARFSLEQGQVDVSARHVHLGSISSDGLRTSLARLPDGAIDWQSMLPPGRPSPANDTAQPEWRVSLAGLQLHDYQLQVQDRIPSPAQSLLLDDLQLQVGELDTATQQPVQLNLQTRINTSAQLALDGSLQLQPFSAQLRSSLQGLDLRLAQAYLSPFMNVQLRSGLLDSQLELALQGTAPLALSIDGDTSIRNLHLVDGHRERDLLKWQHLQINGLRFSQDNERRLETGLIRIEQPYVRLIINENLSTNFNELLIAQPPAAQDKAPDTPLLIRIGGIQLVDGNANFADFSLRPNFATALEQINGSIGTLDNQDGQPATVDIGGKVDNYAPVSIRGQLTPFDPLASLDIATTWSNLELTTLTPYSGKFAGYRIRKGRLNLDLHYRIQQGQLSADNKVLLEDLQLGERVDSPDALDLPVRLAVALLKDTRGNIDIQLPLSGDLNDPQFSVMPIVWQSLRNLILRATQAPFRFIAGLVGGSQADLDRIGFAAGSADLAEDMQKQLDTLAKALTERPNLALEIEGMTDPATDAVALASARLERACRERWLQQLQDAGQPLPEDPQSLPADDSIRDRLLEEIYRERLAQEPPAEWQALEAPERRQRLQDALLQSWQTRPASLRRLAQQRAAAIKDYLVEQQLEAERLYLIEVGNLPAGEDGRIPSVLHLDTR